MLFLSSFSWNPVETVFLAGTPFFFVLFAAQQPSEDRQYGRSAGGRAASFRSATRHIVDCVERTEELGITWPLSAFCEPFARYVVNSLWLVIVSGHLNLEAVARDATTRDYSPPQMMKSSGNSRVRVVSMPSQYMYSVDVRIYFLFRHCIVNTWSRHKSWRLLVLQIFLVLFKFLKWRARWCTIADRRRVIPTPSHICGRRNTSFLSP